MPTWRSLNCSGSCTYEMCSIYALVEIEDTTPGQIVVDFTAIDTCLLALVFHVRMSFQSAPVR